MNEHATAELHEQHGDRKDGTVATKIHVTVTPGLPNGKVVPVGTVGTQPYVQSNGDITGLQQGQSYEITFTLAGANGVNGWNGNNPFGNQADGSCPGTGQGASPPFSCSAGGGANSIVVDLASTSSPSTTNYRMNFNDGYTCDPIIVVN